MNKRRDSSPSYEEESQSITLDAVHRVRSAFDRRVKRKLDKFLVEVLFQSSEWALRARLRSEGAIFPPQPPTRIWQAWVNTTLKSAEQTETAIAEVRRCGLPPRCEMTKNWDLLVALGLVLERASGKARILDAGATLSSMMLPWLYMYGYSDLWGIDLIYDRSLRRGPIRYEKGDLTQTRFGSSSFDIITCLSVIEHGVSLDAYLREMSRLLRPGGLLITSTDYWVDPIDTRGEIAFGVPMTIFSPSKIKALLGATEIYGLRSIKPVDFECQDKAVGWRGLSYTFINFVLEKTRAC
jgi:2-polyprenyl-3-methyl-5-hydroxy-6-metoxy-1,4-benzoquinol methylase